MSVDWRLDDLELTKTDFAARFLQRCHDIMDYNFFGILLLQEGKSFFGILVLQKGNTMALKNFHQGKLP
jgi:hypothetical protein